MSCDRVVRHVIAAGRYFHNSVALIASLPLRLVGRLDEFQQCSVLWTIARMRRGFAYRTRRFLALRTLYGIVVSRSRS